MTWCAHPKRRSAIDGWGIVSGVLRLEMATWEATERGKAPWPECEGESEPGLDDHGFNRSDTQCYANKH